MHAYLSYHKYCMFFGNFCSYNLHILDLCSTDSIVDNFHCYLNKMRLEKKGLKGKGYCLTIVQRKDSLETH